MIKLAIIHFNPIELYPPVLNLLNYIARRNDLKAQVRVYSMQDDETLKNYTSPSPSIEIIRKAILYRKKENYRRYLQYINYVKFYTSVLTDVLFWKPAVVIYFETLSAIPAYVYKTLVNKTSALMIHYHEYTSLQDYEKGMKLSKWFHQLEKQLYSKADWVSHTNGQRMQKFLADHPAITIPNTYLLPNYPPAAWRDKIKTPQNNGKVNIVYVGALSLDTMYTKEFAEWVLQQQGRFIWHIYSQNITLDAKTYIMSLPEEYIEFKGAVNYCDLPVVLSQYQVGAILYKGLSDNYIYNAPNKLFEYFACGLDVWFPEVMKGSLFYVTKDTYPKITALNFKYLSSENIEVLLNRKEMEYKPSGYYYENVLIQLIDFIKKLNSEGELELLNRKLI